MLGSGTSGAFTNEVKRATPWACCSAPRAVRIRSWPASASNRTASRSAGSATPVTRSTWAGQQSATARRTSG